MKTKIRAVGFDLGDTLLFYRDTPMSWVSLYPEALRCVAKACKVAPTPGQFDAAAQVLTRYNTRVVPRTNEVTAEEILSGVLGLWDCDAGAELPAAIESYFTFFQQNMCAYPETVPVLAALRQQGIPIGILTDVPYGMPRAFVQRDLDGAGIAGYFDAILTSVEVGVRKPETAGYLALASRLGVAPQEMLYIGNEPKDVIGASRAGVVAVFIDRTGNDGKHGQDFTITTLAGIRDIL